MESLLDPNCFWNIVFLTGAVISLLAGFNQPVRANVPIGERETIVELPAIVASRHRRYFITGVLLMSVSVVMIALSHSKGLVSPVQGDTPPPPVGAAKQNSPTFQLPFTLAVSAATQAPDGVTSKFSILQRQVKIPSEFGGKLAVYLYDIHLFGSSRILVFVPKGSVKDTERASYDNLKQRVSGTDIIADTRLSEKRGIDFNLDGRQYYLSAKINWYIIGEDYAEISISPK